jgi:hypothetical protein
MVRLAGVIANRTGGLAETGSTLIAMYLRPSAAWVLSTTESVNAKEPTSNGLPEIVPDAAFSLSPRGNLPDVIAKV